jgi:hypothetical protein
MRPLLARADRHPVQQVAQSIVVSRRRRWQQRFAESGIDGLLRDTTRKPGKAPIAARVVAMACTDLPHEATHWTGRAMAKAIGYFAEIRCGPEPGLSNQTFRLVSIGTLDRSESP